MQTLFPKGARFQSQLRLGLKLHSIRLSSSFETEISKLRSANSFQLYNEKLSNREFTNSLPLESSHSLIQKLLVDSIVLAKREKSQNLQEFLTNNNNATVSKIITSFDSQAVILKAYLLEGPIPEPEDVYRVVTELNKKSETPISDELVKIAIRVILSSKKSAVKNFEISTNLVSETFGSKKNIAYESSKVFSSFLPKYLAGFVGTEVAISSSFNYLISSISGLAATSSSSISLMLSSYLFNTTFLGFLALLGLYNNKTTRIKWSSEANMWYKYLHHKELSMYERIFNQYEELYDLNMDRYSLIGGNKIKSSSVVLELEDTIDKDSQHTSNEATKYTDFGESNGNGNAESPSAHEANEPQINFDILNEKTNLLRFFKRFFMLKKMRIEEQNFQQELFQEYWLTNGKDFEWVEPDQDPAQISLFKRFAR